MRHSLAYKCLFFSYSNVYNRTSLGLRFGIINWVDGMPSLNERGWKWRHRFSWRHWEKLWRSVYLDWSCHSMFFCPLKVDSLIVMDNVSTAEPIRWLWPLVHTACLFSVRRQRCWAAATLHSRYSHYNSHCSEMPVWCPYDCVQAVFRSVCAENCTNIE